MSTSAQSIPASTTTVERRFYPRIAPRSPVFVAFDESKQGLLLNVSENGLLVSAPGELACNFVARISIPLNGLPKPVLVNVRVVWASEAKKLAGIQLLDLNDHDRQLVRKWGAQESAQSPQPEPRHSLALAELSTIPSDAPHSASSSTGEASFNGPPDIAPRALRPAVRTRSRSAALGIATYGVLGAAVCLAAVIFVRNGAQAHYFARSLESTYKSSAAETRAQDIPPSLPNLGTSKPAADTQAASPTPSAGAAQSTNASTDAPAPQTSAQTSVGAKKHGDPEDSAIGTVQNQRHGSRKSSPSPSKPISQTTPTPETSLQLAEDQADAQNDQPQPSAIPPEADSSPTSSTSADPSASSDTATLETPLASPDPPPASAPIRNPTPASDLAAATPATIPSSSNVAPTHPAPARKPGAPTIQMDAPAQQVLEIHLPSGYYAPFFNLPGERVLETPSATMHIQRSVRMPTTHAAWPFNRKKKVVIGGLISRADPQAAQIQLIPGDAVRVRARVAKDGHVESVAPVSGPPNLARAVAGAVRQWRYQPTLLDGKPVETQCFVVVQFHAPATRTARK
ncbi:MAG TPA: PilZ domain-containing protein [Candidatus Dormibacteraeota bacterium]|nr:PilZ domain-containing protein [Candidatus Dormibacteraeota bacterium]